jgi:hypothetical protein
MIVSTSKGNSRNAVKSMSLIETAQAVTEDILWNMLI